MVEPGLDAFITEKYASQIEVILAKWSAGLVETRPSVADIQDSLSLQFVGKAPLTVVQPVTSNLTGFFAGPSIEPLSRSNHRLKLWQGGFKEAAWLGREAFIQAWLSALVELDQLLTAELKLSSISVRSQPSSVIHTRIRYDFVSMGRGFHRQQRVGHWDLEWEMDQQGQHRVSRWDGIDERGSLAPDPIFMDITAQSLGANPSYREQMLQGSDYWRTVLDGASRIDIYGNNGIAVGDVDNDGFDDLYVCQPAGLPNRLYRNRGDGTFQDVTETTGVGVLDNTACALFADLDNDGRQDLIIVTVDGPLLFLNHEGGRFRFKPDAFRFAQPPQGTFTGAAIADYDGNGLLDVYFCLYSYYLGLNQYHFPTPYYDAQNGPPNFLMRNNGDGTFSDITAASGMNQNNNRFSFACQWVDYNNDGWPDLYVANDFGRKNLYRNNGNGTFTDVAQDAGVDDVGAGMSVCGFDYDNDGYQDLYVTDMWSAEGKRVSTQEVFMKDAPEDVRALLRKHAGGNSLFHNERDGRFSGPSASGGAQMGRWSWSGDAWDFDHDGYPDLYIVNGMISGPKRRDLSSFFWRQVVAKTPLNTVPSRGYQQGWNAINELIRSDGTWSGYERNNFYVNNRDGTFSEVSGAVELDFVEDGRAFALADFNRDGRLEVFLKNRNGPQLRILQNQIRDLPPSISFRLHGRQSNRDAIGATISVEAGRLRQVKSLQAGSGFLSQHSKEVFFGLGDTTGPVRAAIRWPGGLVQRFEGLPSGNRIVIEEGAAQFQAESFHSSPSNQQGSLQQASVPLPSNAETWLLAPVAAPAFSIADVNGGVHSLVGYRGHPLLLNFWATSAPASEQQLEVFREHSNGWAGLGLEVVTVNVNGPAQADDVRGLVRDRGFSFPVLLASEETTAIYSILYRYLFDRRRDLGLPTSFLLDEHGSIVKVYQGSLDPRHVEHDFRHIPANPTERVKTALPFPGNWYGGDFRRNQFTYALQFMERGYPDQAIDACRLVIQDDPTNAEAHYLMGSIYLKKQLSKEARDNFEQALRLRPNYPDTWPDAWNNLGLLAAQQGDSATAIKNFKEAIRLNPSYAIAIENLGNVYRQQRRWTEAQATLELAVKIDPDDADANYSLGMVFAQQDDTERAYQYLQRALALRPGYAQAWNNLGILYLRTKRPAAAIEAFASCIRVAPEFDQPYLNLAKVYKVENQIEQAKTILRELLAQHPDHAQAQRALSELTP
jgi:tetratricopeptide (TPR) repeat protein/peroxiredoxin